MLGLRDFWGRLKSTVSCEVCAFLWLGVIQGLMLNQRCDYV